MQRGPHDLVVLAEKAHKPVVPQFLGLPRRVAKVGKKDDSNGRFDVRVTCSMSGNLTKERIDGPVTHLDDVVREQAVCLPVDRFQRLAVRPFGETKHGPFAVIEPIRHVTHLVLVLDSEVELMGGSDVGSLGTRRLVSIKEQRHGHQAT